MVNNKDEIPKIINWIKQMESSGIYKKATARSRINAIRRIVSVLRSDEAKDPESLIKNCDELVNRWATKTSASPSSIKPSKSNVRGALQDYIKYQKDPSSLKPLARGKKERKAETIRIPTKRKKAEKEEKKEEIKSTDLEEKIPEINLNIQIHISADASESQIDKIFESMAKHIYKKKI